MTKPFAEIREGLRSGDWLPESDAPQNGKGLLFEFPFGQLNAAKGEKRLVSYEAQIEAGLVKVRRSPDWSVADRLRLARECRDKLARCPGLTRKMLAQQLGMSRARLDQLLRLLGLTEDVQRELLTLGPQPRLTERPLLALLKLDPTAQLKRFRLIVAPLSAE